MNYIIMSGALDSFSPFSNSPLADPRFRASFGMAEPPKSTAKTTMSTITPYTPKISASIAASNPAPPDLPRPT